MIYQITIKDEATYELNSSEYSEMDAINKALDWFSERKPSVNVVDVPEEEDARYYYWAVVNPDGTFAGVPCWTEEEARELACQQEGRRIFQMAYDPNAQIIWD